MKTLLNGAIFIALLCAELGLICTAPRLYRERSETVAAERNGVGCHAVADPSPGLLAAKDLPAAMALWQADPHAAAFLASLPSLSIVELPTAAYQSCFPPGFANTTILTEAVYLDSGRLDSPGIRAVAVTHELVHVAHSHPSTPEGKHSALRHFFFSEEAEAHLAGIRAARRLHIAPPTPIWQDYLIDLFPIPTFYLLLIPTVFFGRRFLTPSEPRRHRLTLDPSLPQ